MKWALVLALIAAPAVAEERMTSRDCTRGWQTFVDMLSGFLNDPSERVRNEQALARAVPNAVTPDGWCRVQGSDRGLDGAIFTTLDWQADGLGPFIAGSGLPTGLRVRAAGVFVRPDSNQRYDATVILRRAPGNPVLCIAGHAVAGGHQLWQPAPDRSFADRRRHPGRDGRPCARMDIGQPARRTVAP
jgi:hypothetical protein